MAESTLSLALDALKQEVGHYFGYGRTIDDWSTDQAADIDAAIAKGQRQFYFPPAVAPGERPHRWSFMTPIDTITTIATYSTGTVAVVSGTATISDGTWPSWAKTHGTLTIDTTEYTISSRDSDTELTVVGDDVSAGESFTLEHSGDYDLPDDFGDIRGQLTFATQTVYPAITIIGEGRIRALRQQVEVRSRPVFAAIRPKESDLTSGQRFEILFEPIPDAVYVLSYRKSILPDALTSSGSKTIPLGSMMHTETLRASCVAAAEEQSLDKKGSKWTDFMERLQASVAYDQEQGMPDFFGYNSDNSDIGVSHDNRHPYNYRVKGLVTYNP